MLKWRFTQHVLFQAPLVQDLTVVGFAKGIFSKGGDGTDINLDGDRGCPWRNLFSNTDHGA
jgi:hypothetical protein